MAVSSPSVPWQRPLRASYFTNRQTELAQLLASLQPGQIKTLCGPGGIGKTALATEAVWQPEIETRFPDGVIFHSFYNQPQAALALESIALAYGEEPRPSPETAARRVLTGRSTLLFLDGTEAADNLSTVLNVAGSCGVLITSRSRKDAVAERQDMKPLVIDEAVKLLQAWGGSQDGDEAAMRSICDMVGGLPLAVRLVGRYLNETSETAAEYLEWLKDTPIEALSHGEHKEDSINLLLTRSLEQVGTAGEILTVVGQLAFAPFGLEPVAAAMHLTVKELRQPLGQLVNYGLLSRLDDRYEVTHALIHTYARKRLVSEAEVKRLVVYFTELVRTESEKGPDGYHRLAAERVHIMRVLAGCEKQEDWELVQNLVWALSGEPSFLRMQGYWIDLVMVIETGLTAAQKLSNRQGEGAHLGNLGNAYSDLGQVEKAIEYYQQALTISREIGHRQGEGNHLGNLG
ncbi:MAG: tetratricopeptide repeat protein, partial [Gammaproteobacteria bacterium]|nr:tetratricopeptide repeat protein [Gammaproteobacteria bacterium]